MRLSYVGKLSKNVSMLQRRTGGGNSRKTLNSGMLTPEFRVKTLANPLGTLCLSS